MRILNVTETYAPFFEFGGPPVKVRALSEGLARRGHQVNVLTADWGLEKKLHHKSEAELQAARWDRSPFGWRHAENGVQSIYVPSWLRYRAVSWNPAVKRYCRARLQNFEVIHIFGIYDLFGPAVASVARARQIPYVIEPIGMFVPIVRNVLLKRMYHFALGNSLFAGASAIVATSDQEIQELAAAGVPREKIVLRRNGVAVPFAWPERGLFRASLDIPQNARLVLFLGRISQKKSPELLLEAFARLPQQLDERPLVLAFAGPSESGLEHSLQAQAARLGIAARVKFSGALYDENKWAAYRDADVFVLPSQNENFGNTAAESIAAGTPVIVTEQCGIAPLLKDTAGLVVPHEVAALSSAMQTLLTDAQLHAHLTAGCPEVTARLDWEQPTADMASLYSTLISGRPPGLSSPAGE
jgi:glycosyltransferase involved in cell wall biosynthesis